MPWLVVMVESILNFLAPTNGGVNVIACTPRLARAQVVQWKKHVVSFQASGDHHGAHAASAAGRVLGRRLIGKTPNLRRLQRGGASHSRPHPPPQYPPASFQRRARAGRRPHQVCAGARGGARQGRGRVARLELVRRRRRWRDGLDPAHDVGGRRAGGEDEERARGAVGGLPAGLRGRVGDGRRGG